MRDCIIVRDRVVGTMKCGIEAGHLRKGWKIGQKRADRCKVVRLMERGQRDEALQPSYDAMVDQYRPVMVRAAMNDAMTDSHRRDTKLVPQPFACDTHCRRNVRNRFDRIGAVGHWIAVYAGSPQARTIAYTINLSFDQPTQPSLSLDRKHLELDARGAGIDD